MQWRRVMPTINFHLGSTTINWDGSNSAPSGSPTVPGGLENQARRNVNGAQQGPSLDGVTPLAALPNFPLPIPSFPDPRSAFIPIIADIVDFERSLSTAQIYSFSAGFLNDDGAKGGPEKLSQMQPINGPFDLFDAWEHSPISARRQIWRGQELFNNVNPPSGRRCGGCHNSANNGTNVGGNMFDIGTASAEARTPDLPLYTLCKRVDPAMSCADDPTAATRQLTDTGRGNVTGLWNDLGRFKTPTLRALAQRAPYFHNSIAATLEDVVRHYEEFLDFDFTDEEEEDLVAFLKAL